MNKELAVVQEWMKKGQFNDNPHTVKQPVLLQSQLYLIYEALHDMRDKYAAYRGTGIIDSIDILLEWCRANETFII